MDENVEEEPALFKKIPSKTSVLGLKFDNNVGQLLIDSNNCWSKLDAQLNHLLIPPACFVILSKPGLGEKLLGDMLAEYWKCVHINPDDVIQDQINLRSDTGRCVEFNLRCGNVITVDIILKLIEETMKSDVVKHRGYVLSGVPLVETYKSNDCCGHIYSEEAFLAVEEFMFDFISSVDFPEIAESILGEISETEEDFENLEQTSDLRSVEGNQNDMKDKVYIDLDTRISGVIQRAADREFCKRTSLHDQLDIIANFKIPPTVIINVSCPEEDLITLRGQNVIVYPGCHYFRMPFETENIRSEQKYMEYPCWRPSDFSHFVESQCKKMTRSFKTAVKRFILLHDPQYVINLDGRRSEFNNFDVVKTKLSLLPLSRVILPILFKDFEEIINKEVDNEIDDEIEDTESAVNLSSTAFLEDFENKRKIAPNFPYSESLWRTKCPVALSEGKRIVGSAKNAVIFFDHIFLLSTESALRSFYRNPRPFLAKEFLTPTCRIAILGTRKSGKSTLAKCLSWIFTGVIVDFNRIRQRLSAEKEAAILQQACDETFIVLSTSEEEKWVERENQRKISLEEWKRDIFNIAEKCTELDESETEKFLINLKSKQSLNVSPVASKRSSLKSKFSLKSRLSSTRSRTVSVKDTPSQQFKSLVNGIFGDVLDNSVFLEFCQSVVSEPDILLQYAPLYLRNPSLLESPADEAVLDRAKELVMEEKRYDDIIIADDEIADILVRKILTIDNKSNTINGGSKIIGKWIIDGMPCQTVYWDALTKHNCLPDDVFSFTENTNIELDTFLRHKSRRRNARTLSGIFSHVEEPLLENRPNSFQFLSKSSILSEISRMLTALLEKDYFEDNKVRNAPSDITAESLEVLKASEFDAFLNETNQFNENYVNLKILLENFLIDPIDIVIPTAWSPSDLISESLRLLRYRYGVNCKAVIPQIESNDPDDEEAPVDVSLKTFFGVCGSYCPVTFYKHSVVWKGREDFTMKYKQNTYMMASIEAQQEFSIDPEHFIYSEVPIELIPPWRMCVTGTLGSGRSSKSKLLAEHLGLIYVNFCNFAFSSLLQSAQDNSRDLFNWLEEPGITKIIEEIIPSDFDLEIVTQLKDYFINNTSLPTNLLSGIISKLWFTEPFCRTGIVLDGFPRLPSDLDTMKDFFYIPDLIIELTVSHAEVNNRLFSSCVGHWRDQQKKRQEEYSISKEKAFAQWNFNKNSLFNAYCVYLEVENMAFSIIDPIVIDSRNMSLNGETQDNNSTVVGTSQHDAADIVNGAENIQQSILSVEKFKQSKKNLSLEEFQESKSNVSVETRSEFSDLTESSVLSLFLIPEEEIEYINSRINSALPEPVFEDEWESDESATQRIRSLIEEWYDSDTEMLSNLKDLCESELLPWFQVHPLKRDERTMKVISKYITEMKCRNESFFEQTVVVDTQLAELLLSRGFYFPSKFGVSCPVRVFEDDCVVQMYLQDKATDNIFSILHRSYVYHCSGNENCLKFCKNPLMYINSSKIDTIIHTPIRIAITGPPKCGKTTLSNRFHEEFGISVWTRGQSLRCVNDQFSWTALAREIQRTLSRGKPLSSEHIMQAVRLAATDAESLVQGFVCDGFPQKTGEEVYLTECALFPYLILNLEGTSDVCQEYLETDPPHFGIIPRYSSRFFIHMFETWYPPFNYFLKMARRQYNNVETIDASWSKWRCWWEAKKVFFLYMKSVVRFLLNSVLVPLGKLCITQEEFDLRASLLKDYCPTCLSKGILQRSGEPLDRRGLVQWMHTFYWFCQEHFQEFLDAPCVIDLSLPEHLPEQIYNLQSKQFHENGRCIVTFSNNFPTRKIIAGSTEFATCYKYANYLFADKLSFNEFMAEPEKYYDKKIHYETDSPLPVLDVAQLPVLGYLEQCLSDIIIRATIYTARIRPKYPGLTASVSAAVLVGLFLKCNNPKMSPDALEIYARRVPIPDERYDYLVKYHKPLSKVPAFLNVVDIAGLVKGASEGQGLGNAFLSHIKACDAIFHLCRAFEDDDVTHIEGEVNPVRDLEIIGEELRLKDEESLVQNLEKLEKTAGRGTDKKLKPEFDALQHIKTVLVDEKKHIRFGDWSAAEIEVLNKYLFLTSKPAMYLVNLSEKDYIRKKNKWLPKLKEWVDKNDPGALIIPFSGAFENKIADMEPDEKEKFLKDNNITSALDKIIVHGYKALQLEYFFTAGVDEVKAWTIQKGTKAPQAAGRIHTDFEKGFIMAEVMHFKDFKEEGSESAAKAAGKYRQQGRNYTVEDGDIIFFKFNAGAGLKDPKKK